MSDQSGLIMTYVQGDHRISAFIVIFMGMSSYLCIAGIYYTIVNMDHFSQHLQGVLGLGLGLGCRVGLKI